MILIHTSVKLVTHFYFFNCFTLWILIHTSVKLVTTHAAVSCRTPTILIHTSVKLVTYPRRCLPGPKP